MEFYEKREDKEVTEWDSKSSRKGFCCNYIVLLQQSLNGWTVSIDKTATDVNKDGKVSMKDIVLLQQKMNGWNVTLK